MLVFGVVIHEPLGLVTGRNCLVYPQDSLGKPGRPLAVEKAPVHVIDLELLHLLGAWLCALQQPGDVPLVGGVLKRYLVDLLHCLLLESDHPDPAADSVLPLVGTNELEVPVDPLS